VPVRRATKSSGEQVSKNMLCRIWGFHSCGYEDLYFWYI
jgi:hypothetical protein